MSLLIFQVIVHRRCDIGFIAFIAGVISALSHSLQVLYRLYRIHCRCYIGVIEFAATGRFIDVISYFRSISEFSEKLVFTRESNLLFVICELMYFILEHSTTVV